MIEWGIKLSNTRAKFKNTVKTYFNHTNRIQKISVYFSCCNNTDNTDNFVLNIIYWTLAMSFEDRIIGIVCERDLINIHMLL